MSGLLKHGHLSTNRSNLQTLPLLQVIVINSVPLRLIKQQSKCLNIAVGEKLTQVNTLQHNFYFTTFFFARNCWLSCVKNRKAMTVGTIWYHDRLNCVLSTTTIQYLLKESPKRKHEVTGPKSSLVAIPAKRESCFLFEYHISNFNLFSLFGWPCSNMEIILSSLSRKVQNTQIVFWIPGSA